MERGSLTLGQYARGFRSQVKHICSTAQKGQHLVSHCQERANSFPANNFIIFSYAKSSLNFSLHCVSLFVFFFVFWSWLVHRKTPSVPINVNNAKGHASQPEEEVLRQFAVVAMVTMEAQPFESTGLTFLHRRRKDNGKCCALPSAFRLGDFGPLQMDQRSFGGTRSLCLGRFGS